MVGREITQSQQRMTQMSELISKDIKAVTVF